MLFMKGVPDAPRCGFSRQIVEILQSKQVPFASFDILGDEEVRAGLKTYSDWPTFPQLYVGGSLIGGLDIVKEMAAEASEASEFRSVIGLTSSMLAPPPVVVSSTSNMYIHSLSNLHLLKHSTHAHSCTAAGRAPSRTHQPSTSDAVYEGLAWCPKMRLFASNS